MPGLAGSIAVQVGRPLRATRAAPLGVEATVEPSMAFYNLEEVDPYRQRR